MKSKCSFILKASTALVLALLMLFGSVTTVIGATAGTAKGDSALTLTAKKVVDIAETGAKVDLAETGATWSFGGGKVYFDNTRTNWNDSTIQLCIGKDSYTSTYTMTAVSNSNKALYYADLPSSGWGDATYMAVIGNSGSWNSGSWGSGNLSNATHRTGTYTSGLTSSSGNRYYLIPSAAANGSSLSLSSTYQYNQKAYAYYSTDGSSYSSGATGGTTSIIAAYFNSDTSWTYTTDTTSPTAAWNNAVYSCTATFTATPKTGYEFVGWFSSTTATSATSTNATYTTVVRQANNLYARFKKSATNYTGITAVAKGTTDGTNYSVSLGTIQSSTTVSSSTGLAVNAGTQSGYTFYKWVASGSGTFDSATSASTTFHPAANSETATAQYKKNYTFSNGTTDTHGTVTVPSGTVLAGASYSVTVTPADGYKIKSLTVGGNTVTAAAGKTSAYTYSGTTGSSTTGTSTPISVVATFEVNTSMSLYIAGRFRVKSGSNWTTTYSGTGDWNATATNIPFTYLSGTTYKVDTSATLAELSEKIGGGSTKYDPVFFVYDKTETTAKNWYASTATTMSTSGTTLVSSGGANNNLKFSSTSTDGPVTVYYDSNTHKIWYSIPDLYDVTVTDATGGSVTASPSRTQENAIVTLTIAPTTGYQLKSITAKDSSNATVTLSGSGDTRTFTMPAKDVTVTPVFEKISYSVSVDAKYSNNGTDFNQTFPSGSKPTVTIGANTATQIDGTTVTASDFDGYEFVGWATNTGATTQFGNQLDKSTTFKPTSGNTQAIARYKKIFTITSSVDNTGTGAGTVSISVASGSKPTGYSGNDKVVAGGSYTITATAKSGSAIESVKVNNTAKTATASQTISSVSANQTVVVKFKSNVYLKGTMNATAWAGDVMQANTAGTTYTISEVVLNAGTTYEFKHWVDSGGDGTYSITVGTWTLNNIATHSTKSDGYGGTNLTITPSVKAKVTFVSNGTKFTSITAIPYDSTTYNVTLTQSADYTITSTYMGVEYTTAGKNANVTVPVYSGTGFSYTVTPASGKYLSGVAQSNSVALSPAFSATTHANSYPGTVSSVSKAFAVSATAANKLSVTAKTNKSARGTVSVNTSTVAPGESITITVSPKNGTLKSLTATYANGAVYTCNLSTKAWTKTTAATSAAAPTGMAAPKLDIAAIGANIALVAVGADTTYSMTLAENSSVTINATFDNYSAESTWYYNGYDNSGNALSGYHGKQMTEGIVGGEKFSYYHVEGRTGTDQLMTITDGSSPSYGKVYFTNNYNWNNLHVYFYGSSISWNWPGDGMTFAYNNDSGQAVYSYQIPTGATGVIFNNGQNGVQTQDIDLTNTNGAYYLTGDGSSPYATQWDSAPSDAGITKGTEYFYQSSDHNGDYTGDFNTKGFYNHNVSNKDFAKPKDLGTNTGDYYINVLYPNTTYTINGVTKKTGTNPMIIWSAEPLAGDDENVTIYAKDGSIRSEAYGSTYANIADTKIYLNNETVGTKHSGNITNQTWETYKAAKGDTIVIKTQIGATDSSTLSNAADLKAKYYVRGFCVNGEVTELLEWNADGLYTLTYKVPEDDEDLKKIEITPIYYLKDTTANPIVTYRVTGFTDELKAVGSGKPNWGDTLYTYPFYGKLGSNNNALGAYPGQPMVYYKGQYQMQIPQKSTAWDIYYDDGALSSYSGNTAKANAVANTNVSGVTMSNGYYDIVHRQIMGYGDNSASADHVQTYDYGDFFKIFNEKAPVDNIVFDFKYETKKHNFENQPAATTTKSVLDTNYGTNGNGFELLTNFHGRTVDLFGTPLSGDAADPSKTTPVYVVSIGGVNGSAGVENIAGYYATEWMVYGSSDGSSYSRISAGGKNSIPPEVLVLNDDDTTSFNTTTYPSADANHNITNWKALYTALEAYRGKPVMISYEAADAQIGAGNYATSGGGGATRNDGRWLYSKNGESITSTIKIQYSDDNGVTYTDLDKTTPQVSGLSAYFTNAEVDEGAMTYSTTIDPDKTFDFEAKTTNGDYKFVGWYMEDGTKITSDNASHTERSGSYTFVAKFMQVQGGQLILSHSADKGTVNSTDYQGAGTATIAVTVKNGSGNDAETIRTYEATTSDITLDDKVISSDKQDYVITVTLNATASGEDTYALTTCNAANTFFGNQSSYISMPQTFSFTVGDLYSSGSTNQSVKSIIYHSYFNQTQFKYQITFKFPSRGSDSNDKNYVREGTLTAAQLANESYYVKNGDTRTLKAAFINRLAPNESNFNQSLGWTITDVNFPSKNGNVYLATAEFTAIKTTEYRKDDQGNVTTTPVRSTLRTATFNLPYAHDATTGAATESGGKVIETTAPNFTISNITFGEIPTVDGAKVVAPRIIYTNSSDETGRYFQYWSIEKSGTEVARCYFNEFNFVAYDNYDITPVYATSAISNLYTIDYTYTGVTYLETSRNQWNTDGTDADKTNRTKAADLLYNDFVLNYNYKNLDIYKNGTDVSAVSDLGYVVERVQQLDMNQDGTLNTNMTLYSNKGLDENGVKDVVTGYTTKGATQNGITKYTGSDSRIARYSIAKTALDNKNRIEIYDAYYNSAGWSNSKQAPAAKYAYKNYVYKVYTYMVINGTTYVSTNPAYFAMYEEATK